MDSRLAKLLLMGLAWISVKLLRMGRRDKSLPPGPPTIPILGNMHALPTQFLFLKFSEWAKEYGGIFSLKVANNTIIVLSDVKIVKEVLEDRANETADRPFMHSVYTVTEGNYFAFANADSVVWKQGRRAMQSLVSPQAAQANLAIIEAESIQLLNDFLHGPEDFYDHINRFIFSFMASEVFGKPVTPRHDSPDIILFYNYLNNLINMISPEAAPVDLMPILKYVPETWAPWRRLWRKTRELQRASYFSLFEFAEKSSTVNGRKEGSIIERILDQRVNLGLNKEMIAYIGGVMMDGGTETSASTIQSLILCLIRSPTSLRKAQEELDLVVGKDRLPNSRDIHNLPYIQALIKELHRLRPAAPTAIPHTAVNEFQYRGYTIPKGAPIFMNVWGIMHDPDLFERPDEFWPERYLLSVDGTKPGLEKDYTIRSTLVFGSGKRMCPGMHLAHRTLDLVVMRLIWAFDFFPIDSSNIQEKVHLPMEYKDALTLSPKPFKCKITPRDQARVEVIEDCYQMLERDK